MIRERSLVLKSLPILAAAIAVSGCLSFGSYYGPETVPPGSTEVGTGTVLAYVPEAGNEDPSIVPLETAFLVRHGITENADLGARAWALPQALPAGEVGFWGFYGDARYRLYDGPVMVTGAVGASAMRVDLVTIFGVYPSLLVGTESLYGGTRLMYATGRADEVDAADQQPLFTDPAIGLVAGASVGRRFMVRPEVSFYLFPGAEEVFIAPAVSFHYRFGDG